MRTTRLILAASLSLACAGAAGVSPAAAVPSIPDSLPIFAGHDAEPHASVSVTDASGRPVTGPVHRGDVLLVHGTGFNPRANQGGFPLPVPPGTPNGVWALYSAFPDAWKPSEGAPAEARVHPHSRMAWIMPAGTLESIPAAPIDLRRSIAREYQPMDSDGSFTARIVVDPPEHTPGTHWGVYVYAAGGSVNAAEEFFIPIQFSLEPGLNTPPAPTADLNIDVPWLARVVAGAKGLISPVSGAQFSTTGATSFSREVDKGNGIRRYRGTVTAAAKYNVVEVAFKDPWLTPRGDGTWTLSAEVSNGVNVGADEMRRMDLGVIIADAHDPVRIDVQSFTPALPLSR